VTLEDRDVRGREDFEAGAAGVERGLGRLVPAVIPPGLRQRVLSRAEFARRSVMLSPAMRVAATACSLLIAAVLLIDPFVARLEAVRLTALLDGRNAAAPATESAPELAEALDGKASEVWSLARLRAAAESAGSENTVRSAMEAHKRLKGWFSDETSEDPD
jgi:hypothetical protein